MTAWHQSQRRNKEYKKGQSVRQSNYIQVKYSGEVLVDKLKSTARELQVKELRKK